METDNVAALTVGSVRLVQLAPSQAGFIISIGLKKEALRQLITEAQELLAALGEDS